MKASVRAAVFTGVALGLVGPLAAAACGGRVQDLVNWLPGYTLCATGVGTHTGEYWQEWHQGTLGSSTTGTLTEYAKGATDPVDPTHDVGTWTIENDGTSNARIRYNYTGDSGSPYYMYIHGNGSGFDPSICEDGSNTEVATVKRKNGQQSCGF